MAEIKVSSSSILEKAATFRALADSIRNYTDDMNQTVENLRSSWEGLASENTRADFKKFQESFDEKYNTITRFAKFLEDTAEEYKKAEEANAQM